jgi:4-hydroxy-4-methyl-2-oxoglutarate aldolase
MARDDTQPFVRIGAMNNTVVRNIRRADAAAIEALEKLGVATVHEAQGRTGLMAPYLRPLWRGARIAGSAVTALCAPGDNWMIHVAAEVLKPGDVLVVACMSENADGAFGELLATSLKARGAKGIVIDMGCRDAAEISEMRFPVWSRAISARGTVKATLGSANVPVVVAGLQVTPGDVVVADDDGVVVVERIRALDIARAGQEREKKEAATRARLQKGELGLDIYGMRKALEEKGLKYIDGPTEG